MTNEGYINSGALARLNLICTEEYLDEEKVNNTLMAEAFRDYKVR